jgi:DNA repair photolyase
VKFEAEKRTRDGVCVGGVFGKIEKGAVVMIRKPIYKPKGRASEYGDYAINVYTGCNHGCSYCYARSMSERFTRKGRECAFDTPMPREGIAESVRRQLDRERITGKLVHLCFMCDPYPADIDTTPTREVVKAIKDAGNHVQILTKGGTRAGRDFDLLDGGDWFGVTISGHALHMKDHEPNAAPHSSRMSVLAAAANRGIKTWASFEPVYDERTVYDAINGLDHIDLYRIGKLNYRPSGIDWGAFGRECERLCIKHGRNYLIKGDLRKEMDVAGIGKRSDREGAADERRVAEDSGDLAGKAIDVCFDNHEAALRCGKRYLKVKEVGEWMRH